MEMLEIFDRNFCVPCRSSRTFCRPELNPKTVHCIRYVMVCNIGFTKRSAKVTFLRSSMVVTSYIKLFQTGVDRNIGILMSLLLLVAETKN